MLNNSIKVWMSNCQVVLPNRKKTMFWRLKFPSRCLFWTKIIRLSGTTITWAMNSLNMNKPKSFQNYRMQGKEIKSSNWTLNSSCQKSESNRKYISRSWRNCFRRRKAKVLAHHLLLTLLVEARVSLLMKAQRGIPSPSWINLGKVYRNLTI